MVASNRQGERSKRRYLDGWFGPAALAVLVFAGPLKSSPALTWLPVDLTLAAGSIVALAAIASRLNRGHTVSAVAIPLVLLALFLLGIFGSSLDGYSLSKIVALYTLTFLAMLAPFYVLRTAPQRRVFITALVAIAIFVGILTIAAPSQDIAYAGVRLLEGSNTISTAQMLSAGVVVCLVLAASLKIHPSSRLILAVLGGVLAFSALGTGSRGPFFAIGLALFGVIVMSPMFSKLRGRAIATAFVVTSVAAFFAVRGGGGGAARIFGFISGQEDNSVRVRQYLLGQAVENIGASPAGIGWGNFIQIAGLWRYVEGDRLYPHNVVVEIFLEAGWLAGFAVLVYLVWTLVRAAKSSATPMSAVIFGLTIFSVFNAMVSGDINDNRLMWVLLSCAWIVNAQESKPVNDYGVIP
ncbi:O-antigen ligase family protein [Cryobacterium sp. Sr3]|uniref:O-antigen ligase family protein n=1 Tax=Cryobacterium sp. Sr3 TaxID=1259194 RepID=UPI00106B292F|nr:O-antigen ligase family protein [Cryobacterium sp. Sr3]TFB61016.1 hypothetical protein E3N94_00700 [Cryobacterium sp. Sr3]